MTMSENLKSLRDKQSLIKDRIRAVASGRATGAYFCGRPGTSKTYLVRTTLKLLGCSYDYRSGRVTPQGLFKLIEKNPESVIVLDDVSSIFQNEQGQQILLAALGGSHDGTRTRSVLYTTAKEDREARFSGGIIAISNLPLAGHSNQVLDAIRDRVQSVPYEPTDEEIAAEIHFIAGNSPREMDSNEAGEVACFLLDACRASGVRPSIRLFVDKALPDFLQWRSGNSELHWHDLVRSSVEERIVPQEHPLRDMSRRDRIDAERRLFQDICTRFPTRKQRLDAWVTQTGLSRATFDRRLREMKDLTPLSV